MFSNVLLTITIGDSKGRHDRGVSLQHLVGKSLTYGVFAFGRRLVRLIRSFGQKAYVENGTNQPVTWSVYSWGLRTPWTPARFHAPAGKNVSVVAFGWGPMYLKPNNTGRALRIDRGSAAVFDAPRPQTMRSLLASDTAPALRVVEPFPWRLWAAATIAMTLVAAFALLAYYRPSAAKRLFAQAVTAAVAVAKAIVDAVTVAAPPPPPPTPSPVASEHPESLMF